MSRICFKTASSVHQSPNLDALALFVVRYVGLSNLFRYVFNSFKSVEVAVHSGVVAGAGLGGSRLAPIGLADAVVSLVALGSCSLLAEWGLSV